MIGGKKGKSLEVSDKDLKKLKQIISHRKGSSNIMEWWVLKEILRLKE